MDESRKNQRGKDLETEISSLDVKAGLNIPRKDTMAV